jgi:hypothetical protein
MIRSLGLRRQTSLRILEVEPIQTEPYVPRSHPFIKRLIGTIRREYLDHCFFWNANVNIKCKMKVSCRMTIRDFFYVEMAVA